MPKLLVQATCSCCDLSTVWNFGTCLVEGTYVGSPQWKSWAWSAWWASLVDNILHMLARLITGGRKRVLGDSTGKEPWEAHTCFPLDFIPCVFPLCCICFVSFSCKKLEPWVRVYAESWVSSWWIVAPGSGLGTRGIFWMCECVASGTLSPPLLPPYQAPHEHFLRKLQAVHMMFWGPCGQ